MLKTLKLATIALLTTATGAFAAVSAAKPTLLPATRPSSAAVAPALPVAIPFEKDVLALEAALKKGTPSGGGVLFYGSSSIRLWKGMKEDFPGMNVVNHGFGGSTAPDALRYFDRLVVPVKPATIIFYEGDNDLKKGRTPEQFLGDCQQFAKLVQSKLPTTRIIYLSVKPSPSRVDLFATQRKVNTMLEGWIKQTKDPRITFVNTVPAMLDAKGQPRAELFGPDKLHMNREGYKIWARLIGLQPESGSGSLATK